MFSSSLVKSRPIPQALIDNTAVVLTAQAELRLDGATKQWTSVLVHPVTLDLDAVWRAVAGLDEGEREAQVLEAQVAQGLEAKNAADQEVRTLVIEPSSNRSRGQAMKA